MRRLVVLLGGASLLGFLIYRMPDPPQPRPREPIEVPAPRRRRRGVVLAVIAVVLLIAAGAIGAYAALHKTSAPTASAPVLQLHDAQGHPVTLDVPLTVASVKKMHAVDRLGSETIAVPAVGFDVPLGAVDVVDGELTPPGILSAYWVRNLGVAPADAARGTVYVVIHSVHGGADVPGNQLINVADGSSSVPIGSEILVDKVRYQVSRTEVIARTQLPDRADVWDSVPNRLIFITCLQKPDGTPAVDNVVIWAQRVG